MVWNKNHQKHKFYNSIPLKKMIFWIYTDSQKTYPERNGFTGNRKATEIESDGK